MRVDVWINLEKIGKFHNARSSDRKSARTSSFPRLKYCNCQKSGTFYKVYDAIDLSHSNRQHEAYKESHSFFGSSSEPPAFPPHPHLLSPQPSTTQLPRPCPTHLPRTRRSCHRLCLWFPSQPLPPRSHRIPRRSDRKALLHLSTPPSNARERDRTKNSARSPTYNEPEHALGGSTPTTPEHGG